MRKSTILALVAVAAMTSCRRHHEVAPAVTATTAAPTTPPLVGSTKAVEAKPINIDRGPAVGSEPPAVGAIVNVPALVGRTQETVESVLGTPETKSEATVTYRVSGQPVTVTYANKRAVWFAMPVPWPVMNAVDALRLLSIEAVNLVPTTDTETRVDYALDFNGVDLDGTKVTRLRAVATKPQGAADWADIGAGLRAPLDRIDKEP